MYPSVVVNAGTHALRIRCSAVFWPVCSAAIASSCGTHPVRIAGAGTPSSWSVWYRLQMPFARRMMAWSVPEAAPIRTQPQTPKHANQHGMSGSVMLTTRCGTAEMAPTGAGPKRCGSHCTLVGADQLHHGVAVRPEEVVGERLRGRRGGGGGARGQPLPHVEHLVGVALNPVNRTCHHHWMSTGTTLTTHPAG